MKKNYIVPTLHCVRVNVTNMLALSQSTTSAVTEDAGAELGVKSNNHPNYNVWDDDWSQ